MKKTDSLILAIDTSCDDTSAAVTRGRFVLSNVIASQTQLHKPYGGVFPTVAKQAHKENINRVIERAISRAGSKAKPITSSMIDAIAVTQGPGLAPALEVGIAKAKELAQAWNKPLLALNHIEAHALSPLARPKTQLGQKQTPPKFPILSLVISGGHSLFVLIKDIGQNQVLGTTIDDAAGECLDKIGRLVNLGYPAGPVIEEFAKRGNPMAVNFPLPMTHSKDFNLSFSGLKTFARNYIEAATKSNPLTKQQVYDFCASIQYAVFRHICHKLNKILLEYEFGEVWLGGGVAANTTLRKMIRQTIGLSKAKKLKLAVPYTKKLCVDNAAMIGVVAGIINQQAVKNLDDLDRQPRLEIKSD